MASKLVKAVFCGSNMIHKYTLDRSINGSDGQIKTLYTRYPIVARALGLAALGRVRRASKGILHTNKNSNF